MRSLLSMQKLWTPITALSACPSRSQVFLHCDKRLSWAPANVRSLGHQPYHPITFSSNSTIIKNSFPGVWPAYWNLFDSMCYTCLFSKTENPSRTLAPEILLKPVKFWIANTQIFYSVIFWIFKCIQVCTQISIFCFFLFSVTEKCKW